MGYPINQLLAGYFIHDCCILNNDYIILIAEKLLTQEQYNNGLLGEIKCVNYVVGDDDRQWGYRHWKEKNSFNKPKLVNTINNEALIVCESDMVYYLGTGQNKQYEERLNSHIINGVRSIRKIKDTIYISGLRRSVAVGKGVSKWQSLTSGELWQDGLSNCGFDDIDGFGPDDLYAVGGNNDVWHYDGKGWIPLDVTEQFRPKVVCCAEDGYVYIAGAWGMVVRGRDAEWQTVNLT